MGWYCGKNCGLSHACRHVLRRLMSSDCWRMFQTLNDMGSPLSIVSQSKATLRDVLGIDDFRAGQ